MKILALDASSVSCSACVADNEKIISSSYLRNGLTHSCTLLPSVEKVLDDAGLSVKELDRVCVTVGPGSFTGIKIAAATVKGLCFTDNITAVAISTLEALAYNAQVSDGVVCPVMDARRGMLYNALFRFDGGKMTRLCEDRQVSADELCEQIRDLDATVVGDGTAIFTEKCANVSVRVKTSDERHTYIQAESLVAAYLEGCGKETSAENLAPSYLRPSQAERERVERLANEKGENK